MILKAMWAKNSPASKFLLTIGMVIIGAFLFSLVAFGLASAIYGIDPTQLESLLGDLDNPLTIPVLKLIQTVSEIGTFILPAIFVAYTFNQSAMGYLHLDKKVNWITVAAVFAMLIAAVPVINFLGELNSRMVLPSWLAGLERQMKESEDQAARLTEKFLEIKSPFQFGYAMIMVAVLPALGEELLFRGVLQRIFSEWSQSKHTGIWATAILFSAMHMQFYGFVPRMLLGVMLGYLFLWSGSLWLPILAHFFNNGAAVIASYLYRENSISINPDTIGTEQDYTAVIVSALLTAGMVWFIYNRETKNRMAGEGIGKLQG
ncbi:MAG: CPBP family intramembrane glutamic endopeptidase [Bacteroidota bacterium]